MKKIILVIVIVIVAGAVGLFPFTQQVAVSVNASYPNCYQQLFLPANWKNWEPELKQAYLTNSSAYKIITTAKQKIITINNERFIFTQYGSTNLGITKVKKGSYFNYNLYMVPDQSGFTTTIVANFETNLIKYLIQGNGATETAETKITDFKLFMEDARQYYGFNIIKTAIAQVNIIVKKQTIPAADIYRAGKQMELQVHTYIAQNKLIQSGKVMAQYNSKKGDSVQMMVGIPVKGKFTANNGFTDMLIPATPALVADFKGKYSDRKQIYIAMGRYLEDRFQHPKIAPVETFPGGFPANANDTLSFKLIYPIF